MISLITHFLAIGQVFCLESFYDDQIHLYYLYQTTQNVFTTRASLSPLASQPRILALYIVDGLKKRSVLAVNVYTPTPF